jgi:hypothetical protein
MSTYKVVALELADYSKLLKRMSVDGRLNTTHIIDSVHFSPTRNATVSEALSLLSNTFNDTPMLMP